MKTIAVGLALVILGVVIAGTRAAFYGNEPVSYGPTHGHGYGHSTGYGRQRNEGYSSFRAAVFPFPMEMDARQPSEESEPSFGTSVGGLYGLNRAQMDQINDDDDIFGLSGLGLLLAAGLFFTLTGTTSILTG